MADELDAQAAMAAIQSCDASDRDKQITIARLQGETLSAVGERFGLSKEQVRRIASKLQRGVSEQSSPKRYFRLFGFEC